MFYFIHSELGTEIHVLLYNTGVTGWMTTMKGDLVNIIQNNTNDYMSKIGGQILNSQLFNFIFRCSF